MRKFLQEFFDFFRKGDMILLALSEEVKKLLEKFTHGEASWEKRGWKRTLWFMIAFFPEKGNTHSVKNGLSRLVF